MIDVKHLFDTPGSVYDIDTEYDFSEYELDGARPFTGPVKVTGRISNKAGVTSLKFEAKLTAVFQCDRCLNDIEQDYLTIGDFILTENNSDELDEDKYIVCENGELDLENAVLVLVLLNIPSKHLCNENCKGLCYICGKNLNEGDCECGTEDNDNC